MAGFVDNLPALDCYLYLPNDVWVVNEDLYYITDTANQRIRMVTYGNMSTLAGSGTAVSSPDYYYIGVSSLNQPMNLYLFGTSLYYSEYEKLRLVANIDYGTMATTITRAGTTLGSALTSSVLSSQLNQPQGLYFYSDITYLVADSGNHRILKGDKGQFTKIAGSGVQGYTTGNAVDSQLSSPSGVIAYGPNVIFTDTENHCIRRINTDGTLSTIAGQCTNSGYNSDQENAIDALLASPSGIIVENGIIYFSDTRNALVRSLVSFCENGYEEYDAFQCSAITSCFAVLKTSSSVCGGHGQCVSQDKCECDMGFYGDNCDTLNYCYGTPGYESTVCGGKGNCTANDVCSCSPGFYGATCVYDYTCNGVSPDNSYACYGNGFCSSQDKCDCSPGFVGKFCDSQALCFGKYSSDPTVCEGYGTCVKDGKCVCSPGYYGEKCSYPYGCNGTAPDQSSVCSGHGLCSASEVCNCTTGYNGKYCESLIVVSSPKAGLTSDQVLAIAISVSVSGFLIFVVIIIIVIIIVVVVYRKKKAKKTIESNNKPRELEYNQAKRKENLPKEVQKIKDEQAVKMGEKFHDIINVTVTTTSTGSEPIPSTNSTMNQLPSSTIDTYSNFLNSNSNGTMTGESYTAFLSQGQDNSFKPPPTVVKPSSSMDTFSSKDHTYKIIKVLGRGGFGTCYLCADIESNDLIAVKSIPSTEDNFLSICSEFSKCLSFQHPRLVKSYEYLQGGDRKMVCLAMKFYKFGDLEQVFKNVVKRKPPSDQMLISIINQVGEGLDYLHHVQKVIHRDIKANNIMVDEYDEENSTISLAIGDFGVSKQANVAHTLTGTVYYASPELFLGKTTSFSTDIFSFGVTMYLIICDKFKFMNQSSITQQIFSEGEEKVYTKIKGEMRETGVREDIIEMVMKMLAKEPENRPQANDLAQFFKNFSC